MLINLKGHRPSPTLYKEGYICDLCLAEFTTQDVLDNDLYHCPQFLEKDALIDNV